MSALTPLSVMRLPGGEHFAQGLADLAARRESISAFLLAIAARRLAATGVPVPASLPRDPEIGLYRMLRDRYGDDAHSQFNARLRRLASLCHALERAGWEGFAVPSQRGDPPPSGTRG